MASVEMIAKANEKRINALERKLDAFDKEFRKVGDKSSEMSGLAKRISTLETAVKALVMSAKTSGATDTQIANEIKNMKDLIAKREAKIDFLQKNRGDPESDKKLANLEKRKDTLEKAVSALNGQADRNLKASKAEMDKIMAEVTKQGKKLAEAALLESRLKVLEAQMKAALSR